MEKEEWWPQNAVLWELATILVVVLGYQHFPVELMELKLLRKDGAMKEFLMVNLDSNYNYIAVLNRLDEKPEK